MKSKFNWEKWLKRLMFNMDDIPHVPEVKIMELRLDRVHNGTDHTNGLFYINNELQCFTLEDEERTKKVWGETRVFSGRFKILLRTVGGFHQRYLRKYGAEFHKGMLWLQDVPEFEFILIHIGNDDDDTAGCILVGTTTNAPENFIGGSVKAYKKIYPQIRDHILNGGEVWITINDIQKSKH